MRRLSLIIITAMLASGFAPVAHAVGQHVDVQIVDRDSGETLTPILHDGAWWVAGRPGARYRVSIVNRDGQRTLNVLSIDGINAMSGETAAWHQSGYVLMPYGSFGVDGWRKSLEQVAAFTFASLPDSYAARTDRPANVGVIGVAVFDERAPLIPAAAGQAEPAKRTAPYSATPSTSADTVAPPPPPAPAVRAPLPSRDESPRAALQPQSPPLEELAQHDRLGTAHGAIERSVIRWVSFHRARPTPDEIVTIHYDRLERLIAMGIVAPPQPPIAANPFPDDHRFVPDPPAR